MKKKLTLILALMCILAIALPAIASAATVKMAYKDGSLHLRKGAGTNYGTNGYVKNGDTISVLSQGSVWSKIRTWDGKEGYIKNLYISGLDSSSSLYSDGTTYYGTRVSGKVTTKYASSTVNLRAGASTSTKSMGKLASGTVVTILGENGSWYLVVTSDGTQGYMSKSLITKQASTSSTTTAKVTGSVVNMRKGPGTSYGIITCLSKGTKVTVLAKTNSKWWKVKYSSYTGYMSANYLKV